MREFEKICNRSMPLFTVQYWYRGERYALPKITENTMYYNPLFVYQGGKGTDVYYDINNSETDDELLKLYFKNNPKKFKLLAEEYEQECKKMLRLVKKAKPKPQDFSKIFNLHTSFWPKLSAIITLGKLIKEDDLKEVSQLAYDLRKKTEKVEYLSGNNLIRLAELLLPEFKNFSNFLTFEEVLNKNIPSKKELLKRKREYIYFEGELHIDLTLKQLEKLKNIKILRANNKNKTKQSFEGMTASKGRAKGKAKIIFENEQLDKIKKNDILVTPMTTPDYILAMKKASAFITDEGGITCHAAITAREMKKPCIIGTKIATQILKDNDLIEVDAYSGVVKILKRG